MSICIDVILTICNLNKIEFLNNTLEDLLFHEEVSAPLKSQYLVVSCIFFLGMW